MGSHSCLCTVGIGLAMLIAACGPAVRAPPGQADPASGTGRTQVATVKSLTLGLEREPKRLIWERRGADSYIAVDMPALYHWRLVHYDERVLPRAWLATELPSQEKGSWTLRPDGTMQTIYRLHRNITWHDGMPLTARDFVFAWQVALDPDLAHDDRTVASRITRIDTPDDHTLSIEWSSTIPDAIGLDAESLGPLPAHLLEAQYRSDKQVFDASLYWSTDFIGVGPYRLAEWERGSHLVLRAHEAFFGGRPKIDVINVQFISNPDTAVATLLAGAIDGAIGDTLPFRHALLVKKEWERDGKRPVWILPLKYFMFLSPQFRSPHPADLLDVRVRRGLLHALDREGLADALFDGTIPVADAFTPATDYKWDTVKDVVRTHAFEPRRAEELVSQAGWRRSGGQFLATDGQPVSLSVWDGSGKETEVSIIADNWARFGVPTEQVLLTRTQTADLRNTAIFPAFLLNQNPYDSSNMTRRLESASCPTEETRWVGNNRSCYRNPAMDRITDALKTTIEDTQQRSLYREWARLFSDDLPLLPLFIYPKPMIWREGVVGPVGSSRTGSLLWGVQQWDLR